MRKAVLATLLTDYQAMMIRFALLRGANIMAEVQKLLQQVGLEVGIAQGPARHSCNRQRPENPDSIWDNIPPHKIGQGATA
jgi:hypothetical protein